MNHKAGINGHTWHSFVVVREGGWRAHCRVITAWENFLFSPVRAPPLALDARSSVDFSRRTLCTRQCAQVSLLDMCSDCLRDRQQTFVCIPQACVTFFRQNGEFFTVVVSIFARVRVCVCTQYHLFILIIKPCRFSVSPAFCVKREVEWFYATNSPRCSLASFSRAR